MCVSMLKQFDVAALLQVFTLSSISCYFFGVFFVFNMYLVFRKGSTQSERIIMVVMGQYNHQLWTTARGRNGGTPMASS